MRALCLTFIMLATILSLPACHKKDAMQPHLVFQSSGIYILCQGPLNTPGANGSLSFYNTATKTLTFDMYSEANGKKIGELPTDLKIYGSKMYIAVTNSSVMEVVDAKSSQLIKRVDMPNRYPGHVSFYQGKALISCLDGSVAVMDTTTLGISKNIKLQISAQTAGLVVVKDKAYVTQPGIEGTSNIVSVINLTTMTEIKQIYVIPQPINAASDADGNVFILSQGFPEFSNCSPSLPPNSPACSILGGITVIDSQKDIVKSFQLPNGNLFGAMAVNEHSLYFNTTKVDSNRLVVQDTRTQTVIGPSFLADYPSLGIKDMIINPESGELFILGYNSFNFEPNQSQLSVFSKLGKLEYTVPLEGNPIKIALLK
ncbi:MAG: DUF5074 domain-containing protein [Mucilaginibacter sp.]|uniref:YncE family protein n=1 Tax=Mucilaginibacter sp. TaxID=1882438 RepID=UPI0031A1ED51